MIHDFAPVARAIIGLSNLKIITFGPRVRRTSWPATLRSSGLYELGVEIEENSELDLLVALQGACGRCAYR